MPENREEIQSVFDGVRDLGQPSLALAGGMLLLVLTLLFLGIRRPDSSVWCQRLLWTSAALAQVISLIIASS